MMVTWKDRIKIAKKRESFTDQDKHDSADWICCAVGEKFHPTRRMIDNYEMSKIFTHETIELGLEFTKAVDSHDVKKAEKLYKKIMKLPLSSFRMISVKQKVGAVE